ncbi:hypothetical protein F7Q91_03320 [Vibrio chagasii]|uniref:Uncharacterized protein n=1 Tax=Vibrio chagasii TaxID=170679 RepID=A0A7V7TKA6_9VIBR|nr:hypothetical protein [Vibrio chagasii]KAB0482452.1 hypothetical protein F7Q91_03320 [Vibrio chagasii]
MSELQNIASLLSFPSVSEYSRSVALYLISLALETDHSLMAKVESSSEVPVESIISSIEKLYNKHQLVLFDFDVICRIANYEPQDYYASLMLKNGLDYTSVNLWFKRAVLQTAYQPIAFAQLSIPESHHEP